MAETGRMLSRNSNSHGGEPLVSVLICSFNAEKFVEGTIRSVVGQTYRNLEILVLDNGSSDRTVEILGRLCGEDSRLSVIGAGTNLGAYGGLNYLLERAAGQYIAIQDHDDIWHSDKIRRQVEFLETNRFYVGCGAAIINHYERFDKFLLRRQREVSDVAWHTSLVFLNLGKRYDTALRIGNDFHFMKNVLCENRRVIFNLREPLVLRRIHADKTNLSTRWVNTVGVKQILRLRIPAIDRAALLCRVLLPPVLVDSLLLNVILRKGVLSETEIGENLLLREYVDQVH